MAAICGSVGPALCAHAAVAPRAITNSAQKLVVAFISVSPADGAGPIAQQSRKGQRHLSSIRCHEMRRCFTMCPNQLERASGTYHAAASTARSWQLLTSGLCSVRRTRIADASAEGGNLRLLQVGPGRELGFQA